MPIIQLKFHKTRPLTIILLTSLLTIILLLLRVESYFCGGTTEAGGYTYLAERILHGDVPHRDFWEHKTQLMHFLHALVFKFFGSSFQVLAAFEAVWLLISSLLIYRLALMAFDNKVSIWVSIFFCTFMGSMSLAEDIGFHESYMALPAILAIINIIAYGANLKMRYIFFSGIFVSIAFLFKQSGAVILLPIVTYITSYILLSRKNITQLFKAYFICALGFLLPLAAYLFFFLTNGALDELMQQLISFNKSYASTNVSMPVPALEYMRILYFKVMTESFMLRRPLLIVFGLTGILCYTTAVVNQLKKGDWLSNIQKNCTFLALVAWLLGSLYSVAWGGRYFSHYYLMAIPALAMLSGYALEILFRYIKPPIMCTGFVCISYLLSSNLYFNAYNNFIELKNIKSFYALSHPANVDIAIARYIKNKKLNVVTSIARTTKPDDYVYFWGCDSGINFFIKRRCPSRYVSVYPLYTISPDTAKYMEQFIADLDRNKPKYIIDTSPTKPWIPSLDLRRAKALVTPTDVYRRWNDPILIMPAIEYVLKHYKYMTTIDQWHIYKRT